MRGVLKLAILAALVGGAWYIYDHFDPNRLARFEFAPRQGTSYGSAISNAVLSLGGARKTPGEIRIGVLDGRVFTESESAEALQKSLQLVAEWDITCVLNLRTDRDDFAPSLLTRLQSMGAEMDYFLGPRVGRGSDFVQYLFLFHPNRLETDRQANYTLDDAQDAVHYDPLMAYFRVRGPQEERALTFSVLLWQASTEAGEDEIAMLAPIVRAARSVAQDEDDVIVAASLPQSEDELRPYYEPLGLRNAARMDPALIEAGARALYLLFDPLTTPEYSGSSGILHLPQLLNWDTQTTLQQFGALPIWSGFREVEGEQPGYVPIRSKDAHHL